MANQAEGVPAPPPYPLLQQIVHLNWSHFKPEFSSKPDEDAEANLLCTNDWMNAHHFVEGVKVQRFCLTLLGEARLWCESLEPINVDWPGLQNLFRQEYSIIGNTREQLFHAWRSFHFDENTETIDAYVTHIRQVVAILGNEKPQILDVFKNTLPTTLYWILFPINDLKQAVETTKRILTKEKIERQLLGQTSSTPFMSIRDSHNRKVSFDTREELGDKIDKLEVMIGKLVTRDSGANRQFKPQIHQGSGRGQNRGNYDRGNYNQLSYQNRYRSDSGDRRQYREDRGRPRHEQNYRRSNFRGNTRNFDGQNSRAEHRNNDRNQGYDRSRNRSGERSFSRSYSSNRNMSTSNSKARSGS